MTPRPWTQRWSEHLNSSCGVSEPFSQVCCRWSVNWLRSLLRQAVNTHTHTHESWSNSSWIVEFISSTVCYSGFVFVCMSCWPWPSGCWKFGIYLQFGIAGCWGPWANLRTPRLQHHPWKPERNQLNDPDVNLWHCRVKSLYDCSSKLL